MTIQQDLDFLMVRRGPVSDSEKSMFAYTTLQRFEQVRDAIIENRNLELFACADFIPPALRSVVIEYRAHSDINQALYDLDGMKCHAEECLRQNGFNPDSTKDSDEKFLSTMEEKVSSLNGMYDELAQLRRRMRNLKQQSF